MTSSSWLLFARTAALGCALRLAPRSPASLPTALGGFLQPISASISHFRRRNNLMVQTRPRVSAAAASASADDGDGDCAVSGSAGPSNIPPLPDFSAFKYVGDPSDAGSAAGASPGIVTPVSTDAGDTVESQKPAAARLAETRRRSVRPNAVKPKAKNQRKRVANDPKCSEDGINGALADEAASERSNGTQKKKKRCNDTSRSAGNKTPRKMSSKSSGGSRSGSGSNGSRKRQRIEPGSLPPPPDWERTYDLVKELRSDRSAPVDTDGGHALPETCRGEVVRRFQVLIALMLSSQTKDAVVGETMKLLQHHGLTVENIHRTTHEDLNELIRKVGFRNNKTKYIKRAAEIILNNYGGDIPRTAREMMDLPGVGPKMAYIVESVAFGTTTGIGVDTHMHRMFNDLGWVKSTNPEGTREQLEGWLPRDRWSEVNVLWVGIGQETQQQKEKALRKALGCSRPADALKLMRKLGLDVGKEAKRFGLEKEVNECMTNCRKIH